MRSKLIITRFYLSPGSFLVCFNKAPEEYARGSLYGWVMIYPGSPISWNWMETKLITDSERVLERDIFA